MHNANNLNEITITANQELRTLLLARRIRGLVIIEYADDRENNNDDHNNYEDNQKPTPSYWLTRYLDTVNQSHETFRCEDDISMRNIPKTLGIERDDVIFDAVQGFDLTAFAALAGSLKAGSVFWLIIPTFKQWKNKPDCTSLRWNNPSYSTSTASLSTDSPSNNTELSNTQLSNIELTDSPIEQQSSQGIIPSNFIRHFQDCSLTLPSIHRTLLRTNDLIANLSNHSFTFFSKLSDNYVEHLQQQQFKPQHLNIELQAANLNSISQHTPTKTQRQILDACLQSHQQLHLLLAKRGRGKSWLVAELIKHFTHSKIRYRLTAPNKRATKLAIAQSDQFIAPEDLTRLCHLKIANQTDYLSQWLIVDEAAMLPIAWLKLWIAHFPHILLVSTTEGYEGSGQGLRMKLLKANLTAKLFTLEEPIRYANGDPLEAFVEMLCAIPNTFLDKPEQPTLSRIVQIDPLQNSVSISSTRTEKKSARDILSLYQLLYSAHYKTTPTDLRRILDAQHQHLFFSTLDKVTVLDKSTNSAMVADTGSQLENTAPKHTNPKIVAGCWILEEGGADLCLAKAIWAGIRRPKGNLVAQSLVAHGGLINAAILKSWRITRIAVDLHFRRQGFASKLINNLISNAKHDQIDYLSVSFGFEATLFAFWQANGFILQHVSFSKDMSSGAFSCMMISPLTKAAKQLANHGRQRLSLYTSYPKHFQAHLEHERFLLIHQLVVQSNVKTLNTVKINADKIIEKNDDNQGIEPESAALNNFQITHDELHLLYGFAKHRRPVDTVYPILSKLIIHSNNMFSNKKFSGVIDHIDKLSVLFPLENNKPIIHNKQLVINDIKKSIAGWLAESYPEKIKEFDTWLISDNPDTLTF